jgi:hypothetical protein
MPQKLIRLTSTSGDGVFNGLFNEDIIIPENSEIALQSLSLERRSATININNSNNTIRFQAVGTAIPSVPTNSGDITPLATYTKRDTITILNAFENALNRNSSMLTTPASMNIAWEVGTSDGNNTEIRARPSPFYPISDAIMSFSVNNKSVENHVVDAEPVRVDFFQVGEKGMFRDTDTTTNNIAECYTYGKVPFIQSTGALRARFKRLNTNGAGTDSCIIGIIKGVEGLEKLRNSTFTEADLEYQIKVRGHNSAMQYKLKGGAYVDTVTPINHTVADPNNLNDVIEIIADNGSFMGQIHQNGVTPQTQLPRLDMEEGVDYYYVIALFEGSANLVLDNCAVSLNPFSVAQDGSLVPAMLQDTYLPLTKSELPTVIQYDRETPLNGALDFEEPGLPNLELANFLGFPSNNLRQDKYYIDLGTQEVQDISGSTGGFMVYYDLTLGFLWRSPNTFNLISQPDNYIVDTQTFTLDSYDSYGLQSAALRNANSGGSRRNILATIAAKTEEIEGTSNSLLQYQPNTLYYIRIKNRGDVVTRQMRFRLLSSTYQDIETENLAAMTLLIRSPDEYKN